MAVDSSMSRLQWWLHKSTCVVKLHRMTHTCTHKQEFVKPVDSGCVLRLPQCEPPDCATVLQCYERSTLVVWGEGNFGPHDTFLQLLEKAMAPHSSTLAWKIPRAEEPDRLQSMGSLRVGHD